MSAPSHQPDEGHRPPAPAGTRRLSLGRLPFVADRPDGTRTHWCLPPPAAGQSASLRARTYAAWFLLYEQMNGSTAADALLEAIEQEMPSLDPALDAFFLMELWHHRVPVRDPFADLLD